MLKEKPIKAMPYKIKQKLRQYAKIQMKSTEILGEIVEMIEYYGVPEENLVACADPYGEEPQTEGLAFFK